MSRSLFNLGWQYREWMNPFAEMGRRVIPWIDVDLPHDAMLSLTRQPEMHRGAWTAYFPGGTYEYRKLFDLAVDSPRRVVFEFEGAFRDAMVYVNGDYAGQQPYGYSRFLVDASHLVNWGATNEVRVEVRNHDDGRWYTGAGLYRDVWLHQFEPVHLAVDGIRVTTPDIEADQAVAEIAIDVVNSSDRRQTVAITTAVADPAGVIVARGSSRLTLLASEEGTSRHRLYIPQPALWDLDSPQLYTVTTELAASDRQLESRITTFGIRRLQLDPAHGLRLNGQTVKLRGACLHHDNGVIGAATFARAEERRAELLKQAGFNAIRSSHNPLSRGLLDACDRIGLLVMDEAFDMWTIGKTDFGYHLDFPEWWQRDLASLVAKDFNHPSVVFYSIGNEIPETGTAMGGVWGRRLAEYLRSLDPTRYVTNAINGMLAVMGDVMAMMEQMVQAPVAEGDGINTVMSEMADVGDMMNQIGTSEAVTEKTAESFAYLDVAGMNYLESRYESDRELFPNRLILGTETFPTRVDRLWRLVMDNSHVLGDFTWTGWDYLGEAGLGRGQYEAAGREEALSGAYPWIAAWCGDLDLTGWRRPQSYYREIVYGLRHDPYIAVQPPGRHGQLFQAGPWTWPDVVASWTWPNHVGRPVSVEVYAAADEVELFCNGRSLGRKAVERYRTTFETSYQVGELTAVAYLDGAETGRMTLSSAGGPLRLDAQADRSRPRGDGNDLVFITVAVTDAAGTLGGSEADIALAIDGPAVLQGFGSARPDNAAPYTAPRHRTFGGRALAVLRPTAPGIVKVTLTAEGYADTVVTFEAI